MCNGNGNEDEFTGKGEVGVHNDVAISIATR